MSRLIWIYDVFNSLLLPPVAVKELIKTSVDLSLYKVHYTYTILVFYVKFMRLDITTRNCNVVLTKYINIPYSPSVLEHLNSLFYLS